MSRLNLKTGGAAAAALLASATAFIGAKEGLRTKAYRDSVGIATICYGETKGVRMGMRKSKAECDAMFGKRLDSDFAKALEARIPDAKDPSKMTNETYVSLLSFTYNLGPANLRRVAALWNAGRHREACLAMGAYNRAGGRVLKGLVTRRNEEVRLCLKGV